MALSPDFLAKRALKAWLKSLTLKSLREMGDALRKLPGSRAVVAEFYNEDKRTSKINYYREDSGAAGELDPDRCFQFLLGLLGSWHGWAAIDALAKWAEDDPRRRQPLFEALSTLPYDYWIFDWDVPDVFRSQMFVEWLREGSEASRRLTATLRSRVESSRVVKVLELLGILHDVASAGHELPLGRIFRPSPNDGESAASFVTPQPPELAPPVPTLDLHNLPDWDPVRLQGWQKPDCWEQFRRGIRSGNQFVILTGPPGTGKTWLPILHSALVHGCPARHDDRTTMLDKLLALGVLYVVPCRPNWTSPRPLLGGRAFDGKWAPGLLEKFFTHVLAMPSKHHVLVLDEMNLSHPEHYLSDVISAMETRGVLRAETDDAGRQLLWPKAGNLAIVGTVNTDETTQTLSPRLKSRAWLVEVRTNWSAVVEEKKGSTIAPILERLDAALALSGLGFGIRDLHHIEQYVGRCEGEERQRLTWEAIQQKLLPKLRGTKEKLMPCLDALLSDTDPKTRAPATVRKVLEELRARLDKDEYLSGSC